MNGEKVRAVLARITTGEPLTITNKERLAIWFTELIDQENEACAQEALIHWTKHNWAGSDPDVIQRAKDCGNGIAEAIRKRRTHDER